MIGLIMSRRTVASFYHSILLEYLLHILLADIELDKQDMFMDIGEDLKVEDDRCVPRSESRMSSYRYLFRRSQGTTVSHHVPMSRQWC
jgi:hypothetical protein